MSFGVSCGIVECFGVVAREALQAMAAHKTPVPFGVPSGTVDRLGLVSREPSNDAAVRRTAVLSLCLAGQSNDLALSRVKH